MLRFVCSCYRLLVGGATVALELVPFLVLALALGFKHSYDADHLVAVANLLTRSKSLRRAGGMSIAWALGHMATASVITTVLFLAGAVVLAPFLASFDLAVALMLIAIGVLSLLWEFGYLRRLREALGRLGAVHEHPHGHKFVAHRHMHLHLGRYKEHGAMLGIGVVHGLASNDELLILLLAALGDRKSVV